MTDDPKDLLIEETVSAFRERNCWGRVLPSRAWWDLPPEDRDAVFERQLASRVIERALDPEGRSTTVRAVLARLAGK
ncbi:MAG: hypothetical protein HXY20_03375 [Acidobacteria bacterium]|nr:hypothetical protein [Acidobacteriota bacterium]